MMDPDACLLDGSGEISLLLPQKAADLVDIVHRAALEGKAIYPIGGQTMFGQGVPPARPGVAIDMRRLDQVIDYPARDMTITVQAGITIAKLQAVLAKENQRLPIDVPQADLATLGGALATNASGPRRYGLGTLRDYVIGITTINDEGQETKAGGRVVKNVAGYDMCKLHIGALGTLGIILQVTLKVKPRPEHQALVAVGCDPAGLETLLDSLHRSRTQPVCLELLNKPALKAILAQTDLHLPDAPWALVVGFEQNSEAVDWQVQQLLKELSECPTQGLNVFVGPEANPLWRELVELPARKAARLVFKANILPSAIAAFCKSVTALNNDLILHAHAGNGIVLGQIGESVSLENAGTLMKRVLADAVAANGNVILLRCPTIWKKTLPVWGSPRGDGWLMRAVKSKLDPRSLFNPGRFVDGI